MGKYSNNQLEQISVGALNNTLFAATKKKVQTFISSNDKEPIWDGHIYVYKKEATESNDDFITRLPVQVKATNVSKFSNKYHSYNIKKTSLEGYFNEGGVIYFVVEVKESESGLPETKIFYKVLIAAKIKEILDSIPEEGKGKAVRIDKILTEKDNFLRQCDYLNEARKLFSIDSINNMVPLEKILNQPINILTANGVEDILNGQYLAYYINDYNIKLPIKIDSVFTQISYLEDNIIKIDDKRYFNNCMRIKDSTGREYITFGDTIKLYDGNKLTVEKSSSNIVERYNTLDFLLNRLLLPNARIKKKEQKGLDGLKNEKEFLEYVLKVCDRFKIDATTVKLKDFEELDYKAINILSVVKKYDGLIEKAKSIDCAVIKFLNYKIALLKVTYENEIIYYDFYDEDINLTVICSGGDRKVSLTRFAIINESLIASNNFNYELVSSTLLPIEKENSDIISDYYNRLMLYLIKAWDIKQDDCYIKIIGQLEAILDGYIEKEIEIVNKAQIEYRLNNYELSPETKENLYKIKFDKETSQSIQCGISILIEDYNGFENGFMKLNTEEKKQFERYPIYDLYLKRYLQKS